MQSSHTSGKITCPKCQGRLGSFDFVRSFRTCPCGESVLPPVHLLRDRVDFIDSQLTLQMTFPSTSLSHLRNIEHWTFPIYSDNDKQFSSHSCSPNDLNERDCRTLESVTATSHFVMREKCPEVQQDPLENGSLDLCYACKFHCHKNFTGHGMLTPCEKCGFHTQSTDVNHGKPHPSPLKESDRNCEQSHSCVDSRKHRKRQAIFKDQHQSNSFDRSYFYTLPPNDCKSNCTVLSAPNLMLTPDSLQPPLKFAVVNQQDCIGKKRHTRESKQGVYFHTKQDDEQLPATSQAEPLVAGFITDSKSSFHVQENNSTERSTKEKTNDENAKEQRLYEVRILFSFLCYLLF